MYYGIESNLEQRNEFKTWGCILPIEDINQIQLTRTIPIRENEPLICFALNSEVSITKYLEKYMREFKYDAEVGMILGFSNNSLMIGELICFNEDVEISEAFLIIRGKKRKNYINSPYKESYDMSLFSNIIRAHEDTKPLLEKIATWENE